MTDPAPAPDGAEPRSKPRRRWLRRLAIASGTLTVIGLIAVELAARFYFQLGDPPLFKPDPQMRYLMVPSAVYHRLGNTISYNRFSMRTTPDFPEAKPPGEFRVMLVGDSVINGGPFTDDRILATELLQEQLREKGRAALVMNASAGSWSPIQEAAYLNRYGLFEADVLVIVVNHEDAFDQGEPRELGPEQPTRKPVLALEEVLFRYVPSAWNYWVMGGRTTEPPKQEFTAVSDRALAAVREMVALGRARGAKVAGVLHFSRTEVNDGIKPGLAALRQQFRELGVPVVETANPFRDALRNGEHPFRDDIHPSPWGQRPLLSSLAAAVDAAR